MAKHWIKINRSNLINRPAIATVFAYFLLYLHFCVIYFILHPVVFRASRLYSFCSYLLFFLFIWCHSIWWLSVFFFFFLHLNILQVCNFILGLEHGNCVFLFVLLIKVRCLLQKMCLVSYRYAIDLKWKWKQNATDINKVFKSEGKWEGKLQRSL